MLEGMLWFDNSDQRELAAKIERAARYYQTKYGARPTLCFLHPTMLLEEKATLEGMDIRTTNSVLPNHFWLGTADPRKASSA